MRAGAIPAQPLRVAIAAAGLFALVGFPAAGGEPSPKEVALRAAVAKQMTDLGAWALKQRYAPEAAAWAARALALDGADATAEALRAEAEAFAEEPKAADKVYERRAQKTGEAVAKGYLALFMLGRDDEDPRFDAYLGAALESSAKVAQKPVEKELASAEREGRWARAHRLATALAEADPTEARRARAEALLGRRAAVEPVRLTATSHAMAYHVSLPESWKPGGSYSVIFAVEGAGNNWAGMLRSMTSRRGDDPFIVVTPESFTNTNDIVRGKYGYTAEVFEQVEREGRFAFDVAGALAVLDDIAARFGGQAGAFVHGFSGGGNLAWSLCFLHPERVRVGALGCPNFAMPITDPSRDPARERLSIRVFQGAKDSYLPQLERDWERARGLAEAGGFPGLTREVLPGVGHSGCGDEVIDVFRAALRSR